MLQYSRCFHSFKKCSCISVTKGNIFQVTQGDGWLRVDVPPEEVCRHWRLACRWRKQTSSQAEEVVCPLSDGMSIYTVYSVLYSLLFTLAIHLTQLNWLSKTTQFHTVLLTCGGPCHLSSFQLCSGDLIFLWDQLVYYCKYSNSDFDCLLQNYIVSLSVRNLGVQRVIST